VDEQLGVFEQFSVAEQARMLELTLDALDEGRRKSRTMTQSLIDAYLGGDLDVLTRLVQDSLQGDRELMSRFAAVAIDERNRLMASRIRERIAQRPGKSCFFAVGAAHYAGERGIVSLLTQAGLEVTRVR
jgi:uncharacterized protein YbaP (TraB family)